MRKIDKTFQELYNKGLDDAEIARIFGCSSATVHNWRKPLGLPSNYIMRMNRARARLYLEKQDRKRVFKEVNKDIISFITGTILGDSHITKNDYMKFVHKVDHSDYVLLKARQITLPGTYSERDMYLKGVPFPLASFNFHTHPIFKKYRKLFYPEGKKIFPTEHCIRYLNWKAFALWYADDGNYLKGRGMAIAAFALSDQLEDIRKVLKNNLNLDFTIHGKKQGIIYFSKKDVPRIAENIKPYLPECLYYKLGSL